MAVRRPNCGLTQTRQSLELGRQVAVDLEPNADLDKRRSGPGHFVSFVLRNGRSLGRLWPWRKRQQSAVADLFKGAT
jgi:hypothetical protein